MKHVLVAEDDVAFSKLIEKVLEKVGFTEIELVSDGSSAFKAYQTKAPDVVVLDIGIPVMDGLETLQHIRRFDRNAKVIMMTAEVTKEFVVQSARAGAITFLRKDLPPKEMAERFREILGLGEIGKASPDNSEKVEATTEADS